MHILQNELAHQRNIKKRALYNFVNRSTMDDATRSRKRQIADERFAERPHAIVKVKPKPTGKTPRVKIIYVPQGGKVSRFI